ncbi:MAG TPA: hypothetical protein VI142_06715 [Gaiellaceae bacterium]
MKRTRERIAKTESLFRNVNEGIREASDRLDADVGHFICECGDSTCTEHVPLPIEEYERVREDPTHFVVRPGHVKGPIERIVEQKRHYTIIEKLDRVIARIARRLNPRPEPT